jgi:lipopolysaccharide transport system ATP-binding protein
MLQIIANTLTPTTGEVHVNGRISALLELGSGFNLEFTGRQNVFFNGQLLGLDKKEIEEKFDEIAAFADIGSFIDQPVKTYSSGMFIRLAFAVATSVEPDIFVVDEALAVGDEAFQRKCFARIKSIQERGGTILFVSHAASSVVELCNSAVLIDNGELLLSGTPKIVISKYHKLIYAPSDKLEHLYKEIRSNNHQIDNNLGEISLNKKNGSTNKSTLKQLNFEAFYDPGMVPQSTICYVSRGAKIENPHITTLDGTIVNVICKRKEYIYTYSVKFTDYAYKVRFGMMMKTVSGFEIGGAASHSINNGIDCIERGNTVKVEFRFRCLLQPGVYFLNAGLVGCIDSVEVYLDRHIDVAMFRVQPEEEILETGFVDFYVEPYVSLSELVEAEQNISAINSSF